MTYRVDLTERAARDLRATYLAINGPESRQARTWFDGLERAILGLADLPARGTITAEDENLRHLLYGSRRDAWRIIYSIDAPNHVVTVLHIRHGARDRFATEDAKDPGV